MRRKKAAHKSNTKIAIIFFIFLVFILCISLTFKLILLIRESQFDDSGRFTISISNNKNANVISLSPSEKSIAVFKLEENISSSEAQRLLKMPIDSYMVLESLDVNERANSIFLKSILNYKNLQTDLTIVDLARLMLLTSGISDSNIFTQDISFDSSPFEIDRVVERLISDELIKKDNQTIQIVNGTNIEGLGSRLARLITNMGGNVIHVATSDELLQKSQINYVEDKTYTVEKLNKVLEYEAIRSDEFVISDITVIIGEDKADSAPF